jgi:hypothetical protein
MVLGTLVAIIAFVVCAQIDQFDKWWIRLRVCWHRTI